MAMHHKLTIHKPAYDLLGVAIESARIIPRDLKILIGSALRDDCLKILRLIGRANASRDKRPHIDELIEINDSVAYLFRTLHDQRHISKNQHAKAMQLIGSVGAQANGWRKSCSPA